MNCAQSIATALLILISSAAQAARPDFTPLSAFLDESVAAGRVAGGSLLVLQFGEVIFESGFGYADIESGTAFRKDSPVVLASISKPLLGTAIFHLAEAGKLDVAAPISVYLPEFGGIKLESGEAAHRAPSLRELLSHTGGTRADEAKLGRPWYASWTYGMPLAEVVARYAREFPLRAEPGTRFAYSGIGTDIASRVAEIGAKKLRNDLLIDEVAAPLGMSDTAYRHSGHVSPLMPTRYYIDDKTGELRVSKPRPLPAENTYSSSGGNIVSTARDVARWLLMIRNRGMHEGEPYLSEATVYEMLTPATKSRNTWCGLFVREKAENGRPSIVGHSGSSGTDCWIDFENDVIAVLLTQTKGSDIKEFRLGVEERVTEVLATPEG